MIQPTSADTNSPSITSTMIKHHNKKSTPIQLDYQFVQHSKASMPPSSLMDKQELEKPSLWKVSNIVLVIKLEESFPEQSKISSNISKDAKMKRYFAIYSGHFHG